MNSVDLPLVLVSFKNLVGEAVAPLLFEELKNQFTACEWIATEEEPGRFLKNQEFNSQDLVHYLFILPNQDQTSDGYPFSDGGESFEDLGFSELRLLEANEKNSFQDIYENPVNATKVPGGIESEPDAESIMNFKWPTHFFKEFKVADQERAFAFPVDILRLKDNKLDFEAHMNLLVQWLRSRISGYVKLQMAKRLQRENKLLEESLLFEQSSLESLNARYESDLALEKIQNLETKGILKLLTALSAADYSEAVLPILRSEIKKLSGSVEVILFIQKQQDLARIYFFRYGLARSKNIKTNGEILKALDSDENLSQLLANELGRPFGSISAFPIKPNKIYLLLEQNLDEAGAAKIRQWLLARSLGLSAILERLALDEELKKSTNRFESTFDGILDPVAIVADTLKVIRANAAFDQFKNEEMCYKKIFGRKEPCSGCLLFAGEAQVAPKSFRIKVGARTLEVRAFPLYYEKNFFSGQYMNHYFDITEDLNIKSKVIQFEKMQALGMLAGSLAHELSNPIAGIKALTEVLLHEANDDLQLVSDLKEIKSAAMRSQKVIENLLEFATGKTELSLIAIDELILKTLPVLKTALRAHELELDLNCHDESVLVQSNLLSQIVFNLVNNACQAMKNKGKIIISTSPHVEELRAGVLIRVRDNGPGILPEVAEHIFEPFFTTKGEGAGTGLGLSMAKSVVESFDGKLNFKTCIGQGTEFCIWLPKKK